MTYPLAKIAGANKVLEGVPAKDGKPAVAGALAKEEGLKAKVAAAATPEEKAKLEKDLAGVQKAIGAAKKDLDTFKGQTTSMVGLEKPMIELKNPGLISIPLGFLCVILGSLFTRDKRSEEMWDELYVRQNTGIHAEAASAH